jgi:O-acetyl-ADP-ribose deacetylase (regulator of RNase III)
VVVKQGDITIEHVDAIVNPANSYGTMGGGLALTLKRRGGDVIEEEAVNAAPIPLGSAVATTAGTLKSAYIIHSPTMDEPVRRIGVENIRRSVRAALSCAVGHHLASLAFPGMGTGIGNVRKDAAARAMVEEVKAFLEEDDSIEEIRLVALDEELFKSFTKWTKELLQGTA